MKCIYQIKNKITEQIYIGSSKNYENRKRRHIQSLNNNKHINPKLQNSWNKYGFDSFLFSVLFETDNLFEDEQKELDKLNWNTCFNICKKAGGGDQTSYREDYDEIKKRISNSHKKLNRKPLNRVSIIIDGVFYDSYHCASKSLSIPIVTIRYRCLSKNIKYKDWNIVGKTKEDLYREGDISGTKVLFGSIEYPSYAEAARQHNLSVSSIVYRCKSINYPDWLILKA